MQSSITHSTQAAPVVPVTAHHSDRDVKHGVENVFAAVLRDVGRNGFASADLTEKNVNSAEQIKESWSDWFDHFKFQRYSYRSGEGNPSVRAEKTPEDLKRDYESILVDAYQREGYRDPQGYLKSLSEDELAAIQQVHHLAFAIDTNQLSEEGALNLLIPPDATVDVDGDGITQVGLANTLRFPDSNTPSDVRQAWETATENISERDQMLFQFRMVFPRMIARMGPSADAQSVALAQATSAPTKSDFIRNANAWLEYLERFQSQMTPTRYEADKDFVQTFLKALE